MEHWPLEDRAAAHFIDVRFLIDLSAAVQAIRHACHGDDKEALVILIQEMEETFNIRIDRMRAIRREEE